MMQLPPLKWVASPNFRHHRPDPVRVIVWHDTEGGYAGAVSTFANSHSDVSAHLVLREDADEVTQMVRLSDESWACKAPNAWSINLEMAGFAAKGYSDQEWGGAANVVAWLLRRFDLPCRWAEKGAGSGFCRHYDYYGQYGNNHTDPTTDPMKWADAVGRVEAAYAAMGAGPLPEWPGVML
jgi:hypothetical protein